MKPIRSILAIALLAALSPEIATRNLGENIAVTGYDEIANHAKSPAATTTTNRRPRLPAHRLLHDHNLDGTGTD